MNLALRETGADLSMREKVNAIGVEIQKLPQIEIKLVHHFSPGVYAREMFVPKGVVWAGRIHKYAQLNIMSQGDMSVLVDDKIQRVQAPFTIIAPAGTQRVGYAHEDSVWTTILHTNETDPDLIEKLFTVATEQEYLAFCKLPEIGSR